MRSKSRIITVMLGLVLMAGLCGGVCTVIGAASAESLSGSVSRYHLLPTVLALASASLLYVAVADLIPSLHRHAAPAETAQQLALIAVGIAIIALGKNRWSIVKLKLAEIVAAVNAAPPGSYTVVDIPGR